MLKLPLSDPTEGLASERKLTLKKKLVAIAACSALVGAINWLAFIPGGITHPIRTIRGVRQRRKHEQAMLNRFDRQAFDRKEHAAKATRGFLTDEQQMQLTEMQARYAAPGEHHSWAMSHGLVSPNAGGDPYIPAPA